MCTYFVNHSTPKVSHPVTIIWLATQRYDSHTTIVQNPKGCNENKKENLMINTYYYFHGPRDITWKYHFLRTLRYSMKRQPKNHYLHCVQMRADLKNVAGIKMMNVTNIY